MAMESRLACLLSAVVLALSLAAGAVQGAEPDQPKPGVTATPFGNMPDGDEVMLFTLDNGRGLRAKVMEHGANLVSLETPDREGKTADIVLGFDTLESYLRRNPFFGVTVGRYANRIANARFMLDSVEYRVTANTGRNHIHGGATKSFDKVLWHGEAFQNETEAGVRFAHRSLDGEEGFPGNLDCTVTYALTSDNGLKIDYTATTDKSTVINLSNHSYFNLAGAGNGDVLAHELTLNAPWYTPAGEGLIPTGEIRSVAGTALDFTEPHTIGARIAELTDTRGYDHNYVLNGSHGSAVLAARVYEPKSGRVMEVYTTEPGVQLYTANGLRDVQGKGHKTYNRYGGFCLKTQHFPDSPNKLHFPSTVLRPGQEYRSTTRFKFTAR
ncbi:MAG: galactose mutarotase [Sedimentisphaerales bacterium]|nr:galactose mutarotase [Sedimentisphaerales bacterium]